MPDGEKVARGIGYQAAVNVEQQCGCKGRKVKRPGHEALPGPPMLHSPVKQGELHWLLTSSQDCCGEQRVRKEPGRLYKVSHSKGEIRGLLLLYIRTARRCFPCYLNPSHRGVVGEAGPLSCSPKKKGIQILLGGEGSHLLNAYHVLHTCTVAKS